MMTFRNGYSLPLMLLLPGVMIVLWLGGCSGNSHLERSFVSNAPVPAHNMRVLVVPFRNLTVYPGAGVTIARFSATELYKKRIFTVQEFPMFSSAQPARNRSVDEPVTVARAAGADAVLTGSVTEYGYRYGFRKQPVVGIDIRLIRTDGTVLWAASVSGVGSVWPGKDSLTGTAQRTVMRMVESLSNRTMEGNQ